MTPSPRQPLRPDQALGLLKDGNARFAAGTPVHPNVGPERLAETAEHGQHPFATVLACSDSRVPVDLLFDRGIGDIFVVRVAGNVCGAHEIGSIEYGVDRLETPLLVVLGHTGCGAVTAVAEDAELGGSIPHLAEHIRPSVDAVRRDRPDLEGRALVDEAVRANLWQAVAELLTRSPAVRSRVEADTLAVVGAVYDLATGAVTWLGHHPDELVLLSRPLAAERSPTP